MMLTAWACAGVVGPFVFSKIPGMALYVAAGLLIGGFVIAMSFTRPAPKGAKA
jgi:OFA family oxalate/formate antiporter-like MFS transporter